MQTVSDNWKAAHTQQMLNKSYVRIALGVADPDALVDASASDNGSIYISNTSEITDNNALYAPAKYATLEENLWVLDGGNEFIPTTNWGNNGFIGIAMSDELGAFDVTPTLDVTFSEVHTIPIPGVTIVWGESYGEYATAFNVLVYRDGEIVDEIEVNDNDSIRSFVNFEINSYDRIQIEILRWCLPYHRPRVLELYVGIKKLFENNDILSFTHDMEISPVGATTPINKIQFSVNNSDRTYDPNNNIGLAKYFMERQEIQVDYGLTDLNGNIEWIRGGSFYLSEWDAPQNGFKANFGARDLFELLQKTYTKGIFYPGGESLYNLAEDVLESADLPLNRDGTHKWVLDDGLAYTFTTAPLPLATCAECLQYIAQAAGCVLYCDRQGILHIEPASGVWEDYSIDNFNSYQKPEIGLQKALKEIDTKVYTYFIDSVWKEIFNGTITINGTKEVVIGYSQSATNVSATVTDGTLNSAEYYTNTCYLNITGDGPVTIVITGDPLSCSESRYLMQVGNVGESQEIDNPLITSSTIATNVSDWVFNWLDNRRIISISDWRSDTRLDSLDVVTVANAYTSDKVRMTNVKYSFNGAFRASGEGRAIDND